MPIPFKTSIDLEKNELQNARIQNLAGDPGTPVAGQIYYNTVSGTLKFYTGSTWITLGRLDQTSAPTGDVSLNSQKLTNVGTPTVGTDGANKAYVDGLVQGLDAKESVRVATTANITLSGPQTIDGVSVVAGNRVLVKNQSTASQNGIYLCAAGAWTRTTDMDNWAEVPGAFTFVEEGTANADSGWICTANAGGTIGSTSMTWVQFSQAGVILAGTGLTKSGVTISVATDGITNTLLANMATQTIKGRTTAGSGDPEDLTAAQARAILGAPRGYAANVGATTGGAVTVTHSLGTQDVQVQVHRIAAPYDTVFCDVERTDANTVTLRFGADHSAGTWRITIVAIGV